MTNEHTSLEKDTSHTLFSKGLRKGCVWEVSWRRNRLQHIDPKFLWSQQHFFLILLGCSTGVLRAQALCLEMVLTASNCNLNSNSNWLQLTKPSVAPGYVIVWHPPASCGRRNCTEFNLSTGQGDTPISSTGCTCFLLHRWIF